MKDQTLEPITALETALLYEARHRHANELAAVLASLNLLKAQLPTFPALLAEAIARVDGSARLERLLLNPGTDDLSIALDMLCALLSASRVSCPRYDLRTPPKLIVADVNGMQLCLLIAYELLANAEKHARGVDPVIRVRLRMTTNALILTVANDGIITTLAALTRMSGLSIVRRLTQAVGGSINMRQQERRVSVRAVFPFAKLG